MYVKFKIIYQDLLDFQHAFNKMERDIMNMPCGDVRCMLEEEMELLKQQYDEIMSFDVALIGIDVDRLEQQIENCLKCIDL